MGATSAHFPLFSSRPTFVREKPTENAYILVGKKPSSFPARSYEPGKAASSLSYEASQQFSIETSLAGAAELLKHVVAYNLVCQLVDVIPVIPNVLSMPPLHCTTE